MHTNYVYWDEYRDAYLNICAAYTGEKDSTGMVLLEIELVTGWEVINPHDLKDEEDSVVQRVEMENKENKLVLYFDSMQKKATCIELELIKVIDLEDTKDALITIYDYYNMEDTQKVVIFL